MFTPKVGEMIQFDEHIVQVGWFNHQLVKNIGYCLPCFGKKKSSLKPQPGEETERRGGISNSGTEVTELVVNLWVLVRGSIWWKIIATKLLGGHLENGDWKR